MGFYYGGSQPPSEEDERRGCRDILLLTRAAFAILMLPLAILVGSIAAIALIIFLFNVFWPLGVVGIIAVGCVIYLYARWERAHFRGP
jgi:hypothetical protein